MRDRRTAGGFSLLELVLVVSVIAIISVISIPLIGRIVGKYRTEGGADAVAGAIREARVKAVASGWQYRVIGYTSGGIIPDSFRIEGSRAPTDVGWPPQAPANTVTFSPDLYADRWTNLPAEYGAAQFAVSGGGSRFLMTFDSRGVLPTTGACALITNCLDGFPISVIRPVGGPTKNIQVTTAGGVRIY